MKQILFYPQQDAEEVLLAKQAVRQLVEYDCWCRDFGTLTQRKALWADGKIRDMHWQGEARAVMEQQEQAKRARTHSMDFGGTRVNNTVVALCGDRAAAEIICSDISREQAADEWVDVQLWKRLHYRAESVQGAWRIVYLESILERDRVDSIFSDRRWRVPREELLRQPCQNAMASLWLNEQRQTEMQPAGWMTIDAPQAVAALHQKSKIWLNGGEA